MQAIMIPSFAWTWGLALPKAKLASALPHHSACNAAKGNYCSSVMCTTFPESADGLGTPDYESRAFSNQPDPKIISSDSEMIAQRDKVTGFCNAGKILPSAN